MFDGACTCASPSTKTGCPPTKPPKEMNRYIGGTCCYYRHYHYYYHYYYCHQYNQNTRAQSQRDHAPHTVSTYIPTLPPTITATPPAPTHPLHSYPLLSSRILSLNATTSSVSCLGPIPACGLGESLPLLDTRGPPARTPVLTPQLLQRHILVLVLLHDLGHSHDEVFLHHVHPPLAQGVHARFHAHTLDICPGAAR